MTPSQVTGRAAAALRDARRVVVKIGSSLLVEPGDGRLNREWLAALAGEVARLRARDQQVLLVSSGAIALGRPYFAAARSRARPTRSPDGDSRLP